MTQTNGQKTPAIGVNDQRSHWSILSSLSLTDPPALVAFLHLPPPLRGLQHSHTDREEVWPGGCCPARCWSRWFRCRRVGSVLPVLLRLFLAPRLLSEPRLHPPLRARAFGVRCSFSLVLCTRCPTRTRTGAYSRYKEPEGTTWRQRSATAALWWRIKCQTCFNLIIYNMIIINYFKYK